MSHNNSWHTIRITGIGLTYVISNNVIAEISNENIFDLQAFVEYLTRISNLVSIHLMMIDTIDVVKDQYVEVVYRSSTLLPNRIKWDDIDAEKVSVFYSVLVSIILDAELSENKRNLMLV